MTLNLVPPPASAKPATVRGETNSRRRRRYQRCARSRCWSRAWHCHRWSATAIARRPHVPAPRKGATAPCDIAAKRRVQRRFALAAVWSPSSAKCAPGRKPGRRSGDERIGQQTDELVIASKVVCCEPVAVSPDACVSRSTTARRDQRNAAGAVEEIGQGIADALLVALQAGRYVEIQQQVEIGVGFGIITQRGVKIWRQVGIDRRICEGAADTPRAVRMVYLRFET